MLITNSIDLLFTLPLKPWKTKTQENLSGEKSGLACLDNVQTYFERMKKAVRY